MAVQGHRRKGPCGFEEANLGWLCRYDHTGFVGGDSGLACVSVTGQLSLRYASILPSRT
jgi:hypothetical protein